MAIVDNSAIKPTRESEEIKSFLSQQGKEHFDDVYLKRKLGATPNIYAICCMLKDIAAGAKENGLNTAEVVRRAKKTAEFFVILRGESSTAIVTAAQILTEELDENTAEPLEALAETIIRKNDAYIAEAAEWERKIEEYGVNTLKEKQSMLLYDYSSLVCAMLKSTGDIGHHMDIYLPESRFLDGGRPFVSRCLDNGHRVHFFPDVAIMYFMSKADLALMGAETFFPNGDMANTIGSELVALACERYEKPLYVPTSLVKVNMKWNKGIAPKQLFRDLTEKIASHWDEKTKAAVDFVCPNLDVVPNKLITAYITENGIIPCSALYGVCNNFMADLREKIKKRMAE